MIAWYIFIKFYSSIKDLIWPNLTLKTLQLCFRLLIIYFIPDFSFKPRFFALTIHNPLQTPQEKKVCMKCVSIIYFKCCCNFSPTSLKSSQTNWPSPISESLFISHFKRTSRNQEFRIHSIIAEGAFGSVFKASDKNNPNQLYALKVIKKSKVSWSHDSLIKGVKSYKRASCSH